MGHSRLSLKEYTIPFGCFTELLNSVFYLRGCELLAFFFLDLHPVSKQVHVTETLSKCLIHAAT